MWPFAKKKLSEPVQSIINTLKLGEWEFVLSENYPQDFVYFTHKIHKMTLMIMMNSYNGSKVLKQDWMTSAENREVAYLCTDIISSIAVQKLSDQRNSFMCLVKES